MYCKTCGEQLPDGSTYCFNCGKKINIDTNQPGYFSTPQTDTEPTLTTNVVSSETTKLDKSEAQERQRSLVKILAVLSVPVLIFALIFMCLNYDDSESVPSFTAVDGVANISSEEPLSPRQQQIRQVFKNEAQWQFEGTIKKLLKNPDTAKFTHDRSSWAADNAILTGSGSVSYTNATGQTVSEPFTVSIIMNDKVYFALYVELNKVVTANYLDKIDSMGLVTHAGEQEFGITQGTPYFTENANQLVIIMNEKGEQSTPVDNKPSAPPPSSKPTQTQPQKPQNDTQDYSEWVRCSAGNLEELARYIAQGDIVYIDGEYYASPELARMWENEVEVYHYDAATDPNNN